MKVSRRKVGRTIGAGLAGAIVLASSRKPAIASVNREAIAGVKAIVFDTFGTVVDWRGSIIAEGEAWGKTKGIKIDWAHFADRWREGYAPSMNKVRKGELPWTKLDALHRMVLEEILKEFNISGLTEAEKDHWNRVWHRLKPWPDSVRRFRRSSPWPRIESPSTTTPMSPG